MLEVVMARCYNELNSFENDFVLRRAVYEYKRKIQCMACVCG